MDDTFIHLGLGGGLALMILREVFTFLKSRKNGASCPYGAGLEQVIANGFMTAGADMKRIREHLHSLNDTLQTMVTALAIIKDRMDRAS